MWRHTIWLVPVVLIGLAAGCAGPRRHPAGTIHAEAADMVDNPAYKDWARFKVGTAVSYSVHMRRQSDEGEGLTLLQRFELVELDGSKAVVRTSGSVKILALLMPVPSQYETHSARIPKGVGDGKPSQAPGQGAIKGEEIISAAGREFECTWGEVDMEHGGKRMHGKGWVNTDVPGGVVRWESTTEDARGRVIEMKMLLSDLHIGR